MGQGGPGGKSWERRFHNLLVYFIEEIAEAKCLRGHIVSHRLRASGEELGVDPGEGLTDRPSLIDVWLTMADNRWRLGAETRARQTGRRSTDSRRQAATPL